MTHTRTTTVNHNMWGSPPQPTPTRIDGRNTVAGGSPVKALSLTRPWPTLILRHGKSVENRAWTTPYRGLLVIHAAQSWDPAALVWAGRCAVTGVDWHPPTHPTGVVGVAYLTGICSASRRGPVTCNCGPWAMPGSYHWQLRTPVALPEPIPARGQLGLWTPTVELATQIATALAGSNRG